MPFYAWWNEIAQSYSSQDTFFCGLLFILSVYLFIAWFLAYEADSIS